MGTTNTTFKSILYSANLNKEHSRLILLFVIDYNQLLCLAITMIVAHCHANVTCLVIHLNAARTPISWNKMNDILPSRKGKKFFYTHIMFTVIAGLGSFLSEIKPKNIHTAHYVKQTRTNRILHAKVPYQRPQSDLNYDRLCRCSQDSN